MSQALPFFAALLIPIAIAGLALIHQGLGRSRSAAHTMLATLAALAVASIAFVLVGSSIAGAPEAPDRQVHFAGHSVSLSGAEPLFARELYHTLDAEPHRALLLLVQMLSAALCAIIPISAGSDRWRLGPVCASTALLAAFLWPLVAHAVWAGGLLGALPSFNLPAFIDPGGAAVTQLLGGLAAVSIVWIIGPRRGKYSRDGIASAIPGHNIVLVLLGCVLALVGWVGLEIATCSLNYNLISPNRLVAFAINAILSASAGFLGALVTTRLRYRKPDASISANGWIAGLVAGSAAGGFVPPMAAVFTGLVAGVLVAFLVELLELRLLLDDPGGAISVHAGAAIWGLLAAPLFASGAVLPNLLAVLMAIATLLGVAFPLLHAGNLLLNRTIGFRVDSDGDWQGMDIRELGAGAYPEFVTHADEFVPR